MMQQVRVELEGVGNLVREASIPEDDKRTVGWCLQKLPALCESFGQTYESRFADEIVRLERGILLHFAEEKKPTPQMKQLGESLTTCFKGLHERLGLPEFQPIKAKTAPASRARKTA